MDMGTRMVDDIQIAVSEFYSSLFKVGYEKEIYENIKSIDSTKKVEKWIIDETSLRYCLSYYIMAAVDKSMIRSESSMVYDSVKQVFDLDSEFLAGLVRQAKKSFSDIPFGAYKYYWELLNEVNESKIEMPLNPVLGTVFYSLASEIVACGQDDLAPLN